MAESRVFLCILLCMSAGCCHCDSVRNKNLPKRFMMDSFFNVASGATSGAFNAMFKGECMRCKCDNVCRGSESFWERYFFLKANENFCGKDLWDSIVCTDKYNFMNTTSQPTNVSQVNVQKHCDKFCSISAIASVLPMTHPNASLCLNGKQESNEALPMRCCHISSPKTWKKGEPLMPLCLSTPHYTPVAAFINGNYIPGSAGILSACLSNGEIGFQMIRQECGHAPEVLHVSKNQTQNNNPDVYYVIH